MDKKIISIDIETLSTEPNGVILSIGACVVGTDQTFHMYCDVLRQLAIGRQVDKSTHDWWMQQPKELFWTEILNEGLTSLRNALMKLQTFVETSDLIYSKGSMDISMLEHAYRQYSMVCPWKYWQVRDLRTLIEDAKIDEKNLPFSNKNRHDALSDALYQAEIIELAREELGL